MREVHPPVLAFSLVLSDIDGIEYFSCLCIGDLEIVRSRLSVQQVPASSLQLTREQFHAHMQFCELTVLGTLVCTVGIYILYQMACHPFRIGHGILQEMTVGESDGLCLHGGNDAWLVLFYSFCDVGHIAGDLLSALVTVCGIWVVRALKAVTGYLVLVTKLNIAFLHYILVVEYTVKQIIAGGIVPQTLEHGIYVKAYLDKSPGHLVLVRAIDGLAGILTEPDLRPLAQLRIKHHYDTLVAEYLAERTVDQLVS